ncbi:ADP-ribosylglycohydrolase family protein [Thermomicrobium sp. 4228-Ro]|uniref:ADP-ribosylglycohydrolase family protein n=1 Tax=Thermomicrobium sp. 4228-Ro TaxID=2993937 RepID=UPI002248FC7B|nr:ADP-ribosylglycohydrolase family protein [Thermomicrobium sp. 4228-Ro]MCX2726672.1 ADP-ribosylglycohydrolase family protein [Thermomicrobium sp. 4228-Ro]
MVHETQPVDLLDRFLGCLLGMAIGDALGMPVAGLTPEEITARYGWHDQFVPLLAPDGSVEVPAGTFTDETELALCLIESAIGSGGYLDVAATGYRFLRLLEGPGAPFLDEPSRRALADAAEHGDFQRGVAGPGMATGSAAARAAPIGLLHALCRFNPELFVRDVLRATVITHAEPEVVNGALAVAYAVLLLVQGMTPPEVLVDEVVRFIDEDAVAQRLRRVASCPLPAGDPAAAATQLAMLGSSAAVDEVVASAFAAFVAAPDDFRQAIAIAVNAGGASDTRGAIAGALAGTHLGARALPSALVEALDGQPYLVMAARGLFQAAQQRAGRFLCLLVR